MAMDEFGPLNDDRSLWRHGRMSTPHRAFLRRAIFIGPAPYAGFITTIQQKRRLVFFLPCETAGARQTYNDAAGFIKPDAKSQADGGRMTDIRAGNLKIICRIHGKSTGNTIIAAAIPVGVRVFIRIGIHPNRVGCLHGGIRRRRYHRCQNGGTDRMEKSHAIFAMRRLTVEIENFLGYRVRSRTPRQLPAS